jgi:uncharacterized protein (DUF2384 family)
MTFVAYSRITHELFMIAKTAIEILNAGLEREKSTLLSKSDLVASLAERLATDTDAVAIFECAHRVFGTNEQIYAWLSREHILLDDKTPLEAMLAGNSERVMSILVNIEHGTSA